VKAGDKARATFANTEAADFYARALSVAGHLQIDPTRRAAICEAKGSAHVVISEFPQALASYREALALPIAATDRARVNAALAEALLWAHEFDAAIATAEEAIALARPAEELNVVSAATFVIGYVRMVRGDLDTAVNCLGEVARIVKVTGHRTLGALVRVYGA